MRLGRKCLEMRNNEHNWLSELAVRPLTPPLSPEYRGEGATA